MTPALCRQTAVHHFFAHARIAARQAGGLQQQNQAHHRFAHGLAHAHGVRAQQLELQRGQVFTRNALDGQLAKAGVDAIDGGIALGGLLHQCGAGTDARAAGGSRCHLRRVGLHRRRSWASVSWPGMMTSSVKGHPSIGRLRWFSLAHGFGDVIARIGMAHHAGGRVVEQHAAQLVGGLLPCRRRRSPRRCAVNSPCPRHRHGAG
jgi:hypothetical protein